MLCLINEPIQLNCHNNFIKLDNKTGTYARPNKWGKNIPNGLKLGICIPLVYNNLFFGTRE